MNYTVHQFVLLTNIFNEMIEGIYNGRSDCQNERIAGTAPIKIICDTFAWDNVVISAKVIPFEGFEVEMEI